MSEGIAFYTTDEAKVILNCSQTHLYRLLESWTIPATKMHKRGRWLLPVTALDAFLDRMAGEAARRVQTPSEGEQDAVA